VSRFTTTIVIALQLGLLAATSAGCGSDERRDPRGTGGASGSGGSSLPPLGNAGVGGGPTGNAGTSSGGNDNGGGATGGTIGQPPPGAARVQFVLKEVH
jgi:hypothetical protein